MMRAFAGEIFSSNDAQTRAQARLPRMIYDFVAGATGRELGKQLNQNALQQLRLQPRVMVNVERRCRSTSLLGRQYQQPFGIAPMGMCNLVWPGADRILASLARAHSMPLCLSAAASTSIEDMAAYSSGQAWFQLYLYTDKNQEPIFTLVDRAYNAGYQTLILTADVPQVSARVRDLRNGLVFPFKIGPKQFFDFARHPHWSIRSLHAGIPKPQNFLDKNGVDVFDRHASRGGADWACLQKLRDYWRGNLIVKGVMSAADAREIKKIGADAIYVSNHGGRQLDSTPPAIMALPQIRAALGADYPLIFDSGVDCGEDVVKALALGANFVMLGRPWLYAMGALGQAGAEQLMALLTKEIDVVMAQLGVTEISQIDARVLADVQWPLWSQILQKSNQ